MNRAPAQTLLRIASAPLYPWIFAAYPATQLAAHNIFEIDVQALVRPVLFSLFVASLGFLALLALYRRSAPAALALLFGLIFIFSYGHLYQFLRANPISEVSLGRHRYLLPAYALLLSAAFVLAGRSGARLERAAPWLNGLTLALLIVPSLQIAAHLIDARRATQGASAAAAEAAELAGAPTGELPDFYYIILDTYTRADALLRDYGYDNSWFLDELEQLGFYVADCSRSNYAETLTSLTSALNLDYIPQVRNRLSELGLGSEDIFGALSHSLLRAQFEELGYQTVAFQTGFDWSDLRDADVYLSLAERPLDLQRMSAFEVLFVETTAARLLLDTQYLLKIADFGAADFRYRAHVELQLNILEELPKVAEIEAPTFTFAHILIPHVPMVFAADGSIVDDPGFYSGDKASPINREYLVRGYTNGITFVNRRMLEIVRKLIRDSEVPPVIVIQGDTGLEGDNKMQILNAYFAPRASARLYPSITPVNTFRVIFNAYLGTEYELLPDLSYPGGDAQPAVAETSPDCVEG